MKILNNKILVSIRNNVFAKWAIAKKHVDITVEQTAWFTGKFVEIMAASYLAEKFNVHITSTQLIVIGFAYIGFALIFGYLWRKLGFYDREKYEHAIRDPITNEIYNAAVKINNDKRYNKKR